MFLYCPDPLGRVHIKQFMGGFSQTILQVVFVWLKPKTKDYQSPVLKQRGKGYEN